LTIDRLDEIREAARDYAREIAEYLFPNGELIGDSWCIGDIAGTEGKSLKVDTCKGLWRDWAVDDTSYDMIALWQQVRGVNFRTALNELDQFCRLDTDFNDRSHVEQQRGRRQQIGAPFFDWRNATDSYLAHAHIRNLIEWRGYRERFATGWFAEIISAGGGQWLLKLSVGRFLDVTRMGG